MKPYIPSPINTEAVSLNPEIRELIELLAKNTHDIWALQRQQDSWVYGPRRDDSKKTHPCLVPYEDLPESEKVYDRLAAEQLIKALLAMGYRIER